MYKQSEKSVDNDNVDQLPQLTKCEISRVKGDHWTIIDPYSIFIQDVKKNGSFVVLKKMPFYHEFEI